MKSIGTIVLCLVASCAHAPGFGEIPRTDETSLIALEEGCGDQDSDGLTIEGAELRGTTLLLGVAHGGGCAEHGYRVCGAVEVLRTDPGQWVLTVLHDANGDVCRAQIRRVLEVSLERRRPVDVSRLRGRSLTVWVE